MAVKMCSFKTYQPEITSLNNAGLNPAVMADTVQFPVENRYVTVNIPGLAPNKSAHLIDNCIRAVVWSEEFRDTQKNLWTKEYNHKCNISAITGVVAAASFVVRSMNPVILTAVAIVSFIATLGGIYYAVDANNEKKGWSIDPLKTIAQRRTEAYEKGFTFVFEKKLKLLNLSIIAVLLPVEVHYLYEQYFDKKLLHLLNQHPFDNAQKKTWLYAFNSQNPVSLEVLNYAYDGFGPIPVQYKKVSEDYGVLHQQLSVVHNYYETLRNQKNNEKDRTLEQIYRNKEALLIAPKLALAHYLKSAADERDANMRKNPENTSTIAKEYNSKAAQYHLTYAAAETAINLILQPQYDHALDKCRSEIATINTNEDAAHAPYFAYAYGLLDYARQMKQNVAYTTAIPVFSEADAFHFPQEASAPQREDLTADDLIRQNSDLKAWFAPAPSAPPRD